VIDTLGARHKTIYSSLPVQVYMIHAIKKPILDAIYNVRNQGGLIPKAKAGIGILKALNKMDKLPDPDLENTWHPNTQNLLIMREWFFDYWIVRMLCPIPFIKKPLHRITKGIVILYDFDPPWRWMLDSLKDRAFELTSDDWGYNLSQLRDWFLSCCTLDGQRDALIKKVFNLSIRFCSLGGNSFVKGAMKKALTLDWIPRGFEDTWTYEWWVE